MSLIRFLIPVVGVLLSVPLAFLASLLLFEAQTVAGRVVGIAALLFILGVLTLSLSVVNVYRRRRRHLLRLVFFYGICAVLLLAAFAVSLSVLLGRGGTLVATLLLFTAGLARDDLPKVLEWLVVIPDLQMFWAGEVFYAVERAIPAAYFLWAAIYAAGYVAFFLTVGTVLFHRQDV